MCLFPRSRSFICINNIHMQLLSSHTMLIYSIFAIQFISNIYLLVRWIFFIMIENTIQLDFGLQPRLSLVVNAVFQCYTHQSVVRYWQAVCLELFKSCVLLGTLKSCVLLGTFKSCVLLGTFKSCVLLGVFQCYTHQSVVRYWQPVCLELFKSCVLLGTLKSCVLLETFKSCV